MRLFKNYSQLKHDFKYFKVQKSCFIKKMLLKQFLQQFLFCLIDIELP